MRGLLAIGLLTLVGCIQADLDINGFFICNDDDDCAPSKVCRFQRCYDDPPPVCSPYDSQGCPLDQRCFSVSEPPQCVSAGDQGLGESCEDDLDCAHGLARVNTGGACQCVKLCRTDAECTFPQSCGGTLVEAAAHAGWGPVPINFCN